MSNDNAKPTDLTATIQELGSEHAEGWHQFTRAILYVGIVSGIVLGGMWFFLYYI